MDPYCFLLNAVEAATGLVGFCLSGEELTTGKRDLGWSEVTLNFCTCKKSLFLAVLPALTWQDLLGHAAYGALAGATLAVLGQGAQALRERHRGSLSAMEATAILKRQTATSACEEANQAELLFAGRKAKEQNRREREASARLQQQQQELRAAERRLQQQEEQHQQDAEETEMRDLGAASSSSSQSSPGGAANGELT